MDKDPMEQKGSEVPVEGTSVDPDSENSSENGDFHEAPEHPQLGAEETDPSMDELSQGALKKDATKEQSTLSLVSETDAEVAEIMYPVESVTAQAAANTPTPKGDEKAEDANESKGDVEIEAGENKEEVIVAPVDDDVIAEDKDDGTPTPQVTETTKDAHDDDQIKEASTAVVEEVNTEDAETQEAFLHALPAKIKEDEVEEEEAAEPAEAETALDAANTSGTNIDELPAQANDSVMSLSSPTVTPIPALAAEEEAEEPLDNSQVQVQAGEANDDSISDVLEPSPRGAIAVPRLEIPTDDQRGEENAFSISHRSDVSGGTSELLAGAADQIDTRRSPLPEEDASSIEMSTPRDQPQDEVQGSYKDELDNLLSEYSQQWARQKAEVEVVAPARVQYTDVTIDDESDDNLEVIDDVIADADSSSADNSMSTEGLLDDYQLPVTQERKTEMTQRDVRENKSYRSVTTTYQSVTTSLPDYKSYRMQNYSPPAVDILSAGDTESLMNNSLNQSSLRSESVVSEQRSYKRTSSVVSTNQTRQTALKYNTNNTDTKLKSQPITLADLNISDVTEENVSQLGELNSSINSSMLLPAYQNVATKKGFDETKSDSGLSESTLDGDDTFSHVTTSTAIQDMVDLGKYQSRVPVPAPIQITAYPVFTAKYGGGEGTNVDRQTTKSPAVKAATPAPLVAQSPTLPPDDSVLEGQELVAKYAPAPPTDPIERIIQTLGDSVLKDAESLTVKGDQEGDPPTKVPAKVREIITKNLSSEDVPNMSSSVGSEHVREENRMLQAELNRVEDLLAASRAERDEIGIKYNALSERLEQALQLEKGEAAREDPNTQGLFQQNIELRRRLEDEHSGYKRKLQAYQEGQQRQAQLVQKLQAKVLSYKKRVSTAEDENRTLKGQLIQYRDMCGALERRCEFVEAKVLQYKRKCGDLDDTVRKQRAELDFTKQGLGNKEEELRRRLDSSELRLRTSEADHHMDVETALVKLEEEQQRASSLAHVNAMLREQLDQATAANQQLTSDIHKLTQDWQRARGELESKEAEWREEEQSFNEYFSNEHSRLLHLWRAVVSFRRQFSEMKSSTERDLSHVRADVTRASRSMHSACLNLSANVRNEDTQSQLNLSQKDFEISQLKAAQESSQAKLAARISELTALNEKLKGQCEEKDRNMQSVRRTVEQLESRLGETGQEVRVLSAARESGSVERDEIDAMHEALRRIAAEVICDADRSLMDDSSDPELSTKVLRPDSPLRSYSPARDGRRSPSRSPTRGGRGRSLSPSRAPTFADSTFSAVQAALNKRQLQVSELRAKLTSQKEQGGSLRKTVDDLENERRRTEQNILQLREERDTAMRAQQDALRSSDRVKNTLDVTQSERSQLERVRQTLNDQIDALTAENSKLQACNAEIQRQRDQVEDEKEDVTKDKARQMKENERCQKVIEQCEGKISKLKEDMLNTKEALNRALLDKDVLEQERAEVCEALSRAELSNAELELEINKVKTEEASLRDALLKMQALNEGLGQDKIELNKIIMQMEAEKQHLQGEKATVEQEKFGLKEELVRVEQEKQDVENEKSGVMHNLNLTEMTREKLEQEIGGLNRERGELIEQLNAVSRQKTSLAEELLGARKEIERQSDTIVRIAKAKEELTRDKAELSVQLTASERENRQQSELVSGLKSDKEALETNLHESQNTCAALEVRKEQLEGENQELILKKEHMTGDTARERKEHALECEKLDKQYQNLQNKLAQTEKDLQLALKQEQQAHEEDIERLSKEKEHQRCEMESQRDEILHQHAMEKEDMTTRATREQEELNDALNALQRDRDEQLLLAENDKQQALSLAEQEKSSLQEKLANVSGELENANVEYDKLKREALAKQDADRNSIMNLQGELKSFREQFEETCVAHEKELKDMSNQIKDLERQKEAALREVAELKVQLKMVEETRDAIRRDLIEANRAIREGEESRDLMRKEIVEHKRVINEEIHEKETVQATANELRGNVKRIEGEKTELSRLLQEARQRIGVLEEQKAGVQKEASDLRHSLREVEKARLDARRELQDLRRQVKMLDSERNKLGGEVSDLQARVAHDEQKEEESRRENFGLKQKVVETEASREALRKELANLQRKMAEFEDEARLKEKDYQLALEDSHRMEKKLDDQRRNLEISLENANAELADLKLKLSGSEGRVNALEAQLARTEGAKKDIEFKMSSIVSSLRRTIGLRERMPRSASPLRARSPSPRRSRPNSPTKGFENTYSTTTEGRGSPIPRTGSPDRARSPMRSLSPSRDMQIPASDVDPELVRASLRDFVQQLAGAERERDDALAQMRSIGVQLREMEEDRDRTEARLQQLQRSLGEAEEGKKDIDSRLASAQTALMLQEETIRRNERERKAMSDKISNLERNLAAAETDKRQQQERIQKMKNNEAKLEEDKKNLRVNLDDAENRVTKGELARRSLEGDLQRMKLALNDKETENQVLQDRANSLVRQIGDLEDKAQSLQTTIDRLSHTLLKTEESDHAHKDKVQNLNVTLSEHNQAMSELQERLTQMQRALTSSEHDRRVLQERLDNTRTALNEAKKQNHALMERVQGMQNELADSEVRRAELETQVRGSHVALVQRQEAEQELAQRLQKAQNEKQSMGERVAALQRSLAAIEHEKREIERSANRIEKDKGALRKTLDKVQREQMKGEEYLNRSVLERTTLDRNLTKLEEDNTDLNRNLQGLQGQLAALEQEHSQRLIDLTTRHRHETEMETERLRSAQIQAERMLEARERAHRQRVKGLEEQIATLKDQLSQEMRKRQQYISRSVKTGDEIADIRSMLDQSLGKVAFDPDLDPILLEQETKKLDDDMGYRSRHVPPRRRSPHRGPSPARLGRVTSTPVAGRSMRRSATSPLRRA